MVIFWGRQGPPFSLFTTGNPFLGTKLLGFSIERGSGALKGLTASASQTYGVVLSYTARVDMQASSKTQQKTKRRKTKKKPWFYWLEYLSLQLASATAAVGARACGVSHFFSCVRLCGACVVRVSVFFGFLFGFFFFPPQKKYVEK